jgi:hypothetical protein
VKLDDIFALWDIDCKIDKTDLTNEAIKIPQLHNKYYRIYINERLTLRKYETQLKLLKKDKFDFYTEGPTEETHALGWKLPPRGNILKVDANGYVETDKDIIDLTLKIGLQTEKTGLLESIIKSIANRNFIITNAITFEKFQLGI